MEYKVKLVEGVVQVFCVLTDAQEDSTEVANYNCHAACPFRFVNCLLHISFASAQLVCVRL